MRLPGNRSLVGRGGLLVLAKTRVRQSQVVFRLDIFRIDLQALLKRADGFRKSILVVLGAAKVVPPLGIIGSPLEHLGQPFVGVQVVTQQNIIESHDFQIRGDGGTVFCACGKLR